MDLARVSFKGQRRKDGSTCSWCKLVGVRSPEAATLTHCGACWKKRRVKILYCGRRCQREAWPQHRVECADAVAGSRLAHKFWVSTVNLSNETEKIRKCYRKKAFSP